MSDDSEHRRADRGTPRPARRAVRDWLVRIGFLAVVLGCGIWSLDGRWDELGSALRAASGVAIAAGVVLTCAGLGITSIVWRRILRSFDHDLPVTQARSVFFVSQLGKYVPGGVWAIGVQARLSARHAVPVRVSITAALVFTFVHLATAAMFGGLLVGVADVAVPGPRWWWVLGGLLGALGLVPAVSSWLLRRMAGVELRADLRDAASMAALMTLTWVLYATAVLLLVPDPDPATWIAVAVAFAAGYVAGVVVVIAPAGLGAREAVFVVVLSPVTGLPVATAVALLARVVHAVADLAMAAGAWGWAQRRAVSGDTEATQGTASVGGA